MHEKAHTRRTFHDGLFKCEIDHTRSAMNHILFRDFDSVRDFLETIYFDSTFSIITWTLCVILYGLSLFIRVSFDWESQAAVSWVNNAVTKDDVTGVPSSTVVTNNERLQASRQAAFAAAAASARRRRSKSPAPVFIRRDGVSSNSMHTTMDSRQHLG